MDSRRIRGKQTTSYEGCLPEVGVEPQDKIGAQRTLPAEANGQDNGNAGDFSLLERILNKKNLHAAYKQVMRNKGSHGVDGMAVDELLPYLNEEGGKLIEMLKAGTYRPKPVRRVEIPKPDGGVRLLGIPTVVDRMLQQAIAQILNPIFDPGFSENSFGFRPGKSAHQAILKAQEYMNMGYTWVVDIDLAKYFDTVNHDKLMSLVARRIKDKRVLKLIREYLKAGVMINGVVIDTTDGCPQGGPLSPLLSNIMLDELDKELEKRGHKFCRYADDCNIYVRSRKAAERTMKSVVEFLEGPLKLKVNKEKSAVDRPWKRKFLGFSFYCAKKGIGIRVHEKSIKRVREKIRAITSRSNGKSMEYRLTKLAQLINGWVNYFGIADMKNLAQNLDEWTRRRLRMCIWKQWKKIKTKHDNLVKLGIDNRKAWEFANTRKGYWRVSNSPILARTITNERLKKRGFTGFVNILAKVH
jgi:group II intron reverse transcriptase/maturase